MEKADQLIKKHYKLIVFTIMAYFTIVSVLNAKNDAAIFDEVAHIPAGYSYLTQHDTRLNPEHPPLIKDLAALPLLFLHLNFNVNGQSFWDGSLPGKWDEGQWAAGNYLLYQAGNDPQQIVFIARLPLVLLSIIFGLFIFKWGREIGGIYAGLFALTLYAFDPNILGHNHFVTTDLGVAAFLTFSFYYFLKFIKHPHWKNVFLGGFFLGLLLVSKYSSIVALPVYGIILIIYPLVKNNRDGENNWKIRLANLGKYLFRGIVAFAIAAIVIWVVFKANTYRMPKEIFDQTIDYFFSPTDTSIKAHLTNKILHAFNSNNLIAPWSHYLFGPAWTVKRVTGGNGAYFLGQVGNGFISYFPIVFIIKETLPFLLLCILAIIFTLKDSIQAFAKNSKSFKEMRAALRKFLRYSVSWYAMLIFIVLYAYLSISGGLNIGFRHLFPILPLAYLLVTKKIFDFLRQKHAVTKKAHILILSFIVLWIVAEPIANYPFYTSYFNEVVGGPKNGYNYVTDSNADWGQDLNRLKIWLDQHPNIDKIHVDYFGGGNPQMLLGNKYLPWSDNTRPIEAGWYAISVNFREGSIYDKTKPDDQSYRWTLAYKPFDQVGTSILIYYVPTAPLGQ
jgi:hypothetical protein